MDPQEALTFSASAPFIVMILGLVKGYFVLPSRVIPALAIALAFAWGAVLAVGGYLDGYDPAVFTLTGFTVGFAACGLQSAYRTFEPDPRPSAKRARRKAPPPIIDTISDHEDGEPD